MKILLTLIILFSGSDQPVCSFYFEDYLASYRVTDGRWTYVGNAPIAYNEYLRTLDELITIDRDWPEVVECDQTMFCLWKIRSKDEKFCDMMRKHEGFVRWSEL